ncbi:MAG: glycosyltransferase family 4 protein [Alphaproteobacteria bacterium]|nr:glycosyltransferase family 4 protein [Alphaproteobacteria bacterium]
MTADAVGGVWTYAVDLARGLSRHDATVTLAVMGPAPSPAQRAQAEAVPGLVVEHAAFRLEWVPGADLDVERAGDWLLGLERRIGADVVHVNGFAHAALPWTAPCLLVAHSCVRSWFRAVRQSEAPAEYDAYARRARAGLAAARLVIAPTTAFLCQLESLYGPLPHGRAIWNGRDSAAALPILKERLVFGAGRLWDDAKNLSALDAAAARIDIPVAVAGEAGHAEPGKAQRLGVLDAAEMRRWLARARVFALPSRYEPFGLAALEAAQAGCALVLGDIATLRELWSGAARFVDPDDHAGLAEALTSLGDDARAATALDQAARRRARGFTLRRMTDAYLRSYATLADGPAAKPARAAQL